MKNKTEQQKKFQQDMRAIGCAVTGDSTNIQLHHVVGRSFVQDKIWIGEWFVLPLHVSLHDVSSNHPENVTHHRHAFTDKHGLQCQLWLRQVNAIKLSIVMGILPAGSKNHLPPKEVEAAIFKTGY